MGEMERREVTDHAREADRSTEHHAGTEERSNGDPDERIEELMERRETTDAIKRYATPYMVNMIQKPPMIIAEYSDTKAWITAAGILGIDVQELYDHGMVRRLMDDEETLGIRRAGKTAVLRIHNEKYGTKKILAVCREDALRQAAQMWGIHYHDLMNTQTRVKGE